MGGAEDARGGRIQLKVRGNLMAFVAELGARAELLTKETDGTGVADAVHTLELALPADWPMPAFLKWAVDHVEVLEAQPRRLSMEEVFVQSVESAQA